jgi:hypothetical protein
MDYDNRLPIYPIQNLSMAAAEESVQADHKKPQMLTQYWNIDLICTYEYSM